MWDMFLLLFYAVFPLDVSTVPPGHWSLSGHDTRAGFFFWSRVTCPCVDWRVWQCTNIHFGVLSEVPLPYDPHIYAQLVCYSLPVDFLGVRGLFKKSFVFQEPWHI